MRANLKQIAEYLGISVSTVSRVVTGKDRVSPETRAAVLEALKVFNYQPNEIARSLKTQTSNAIGIIVPDITNNFFSSVIKGVESITRKNNYSAILCNSEGDAKREAEYLKLLLQKQVSALVIAMVSEDVSIFKTYKELGIPVIFIDNLPKIEAKFDFVTIDNVEASYKLTKHLIALGHTKIAAISGPLSESTGYERVQGFKKAMQESNLQIKQQYVHQGSFKMETGYRISKKLFSSKDRPTALFVANNMQAYGALHALRECGLRVPEDVALVCFDAVDITGLIVPKITAMVQPAEKIGELAGQIITRKLSNTDLQVYENIILDAELVIEDSCGFKLKKDTMPNI
jgi:LacI family transcriptional regulator